MISKYLRKNSGLPADDVEHSKEGLKKRFDKNAGIKPKTKIKSEKRPYPVQEEDTHSAPDDDSAEIKYEARKKKKP